MGRIAARNVFPFAISNRISIALFSRSDVCQGELSSRLWTSKQTFSPPHSPARTFADLSEKLWRGKIFHLGMIVALVIPWGICICRNRRGRFQGPEPYCWPENKHQIKSFKRVGIHRSTVCSIFTKKRWKMRRTNTTRRPSPDITKYFNTF